MFKNSKVLKPKVILPHSKSKTKNISYLGDMVHIFKKTIVENIRKILPHKKNISYSKILNLYISNL